MRALQLAVLVFGCHHEEPAPPPDVIVLGKDDVVAVRRDTIAVGPRISGRLQAADAATLKAEVAGSLLGLTVEVGQPVSKGQVIARIDAPAAQAAVSSAVGAVASARVDLASAERDLDRMRRLLAGGAVARRDVEVAQTTVAAKRSALSAALAQQATAQEQVGDAVVVSPLEGRVATVPVHDGDVVTVGQELVTVLDPSSLRLEASVPTAVVEDLVVGAEVRFDVQGVPGTTFAGRVTRIAPTVDPATGQIPVLVQVPNPSGRLPAGLYAEGRLVLPRGRGLVVPFAALDLAAVEPVVLRVEAGHVAALPVRIVATDERAEEAEITGAVEVGDLVVVGAVRERLADGAAVEIASGPPTAGP